MDPGNIGKPPVNPANPLDNFLDELKKDDMFTSEGICYDYENQILSLLTYFDLLAKSIEKGTPDPKSIEYIREDLEGCKNYSTYFEALNKHSITHKRIDLLERLTEKGRADWTRLDEIVAEMKSIGTTLSLDPNDTDKLSKDLQKLRALYTEVQKLLGK